jgi:beta-aspartyl-peptidase (threonine type)
MEIFEVAAPEAGPSLALHGGAGGRLEELTLTARAPYEQGLRTAYRAGWQVLAAGGGALDAVCASALARAVMEDTDHVLIVDPDVAFLERHGLAVVDRSYFITEARQQQLDRLTGGRATAARHGTVGAAARDADGHVAAATSTGGMVGQAEGRVGDSPIVGAGVYARDQVVAISSTGHGEAFIRGVVAYDVAARIRYASADLAQAVRGTIEAELAQRGSTGGLIAVGGDGRIVVAHNSAAMFSARGTSPEPALTT